MYLAPIPEDRELNYLNYKGWGRLKYLYSMSSHTHAHNKLQLFYEFQKHHYSQPVLTDNNWYQAEDFHLQNYNRFESGCCHFQKPYQ